MIHSSNAINAAQQFNRNQWLKHAETALSEQIMQVSRRGHRTLDVCLHDITKGAENLGEAGEMCTLLQKELKSFGYTTKITPDGQFTINW